jgi:hypothetical protein
VTIKRSPAGLIARLIADLGVEDEIQREAAIARLAIIGAPAVPHLKVAIARDARVSFRVAALRVLEAIGTNLALEPALDQLDAPEPEVAISAIAVVRRFLRSAEGPLALDRLAAVALDTERADQTRLAAIDALQDVGSRALEPVLSQLGQDRSPAVRERGLLSGRLVRSSVEPPADPVETMERHASGELPDIPAGVRALIASHGATTPLPTLHRLVGAVKAREAETASADRRLEWMAVRAAVHHTLASRQSSVALYDLRETLEAADGPLPGEFLAALEIIGDASTLEPIAKAYARASAAPAPNDWWRQHLAQAFRTILQRERAAVRSALMKRIRARWPEAAEKLSTPSRTRPS